MYLSMYISSSFILNFYLYTIGSVLYAYSSDYADIGTGPIFHYYIDCSSSDITFTACASRKYPAAYEMCSHYDDVVLWCSGKLKLLYTKNKSGKKHNIIIIIIMHLQLLAMKEMLGYMEVRSREPELFLSVLMVPGARFVEAKTILDLPLSSVPNLVTHLMVSESLQIYYIAKLMRNSCACALIAGALAARGIWSGDYHQYHMYHPICNGNESHILDCLYSNHDRVPNSCRESDLQFSYHYDQTSVVCLPSNVIH